MAKSTGGAALRQETLLKIASDHKIENSPAALSATAVFGMNSFNDKVMREKLPKEIGRASCRERV